MDVSVDVAQLKDKVPQEVTEAGYGAALAIAYREASNWFDKLCRYSTTAERTFFRATRELAMIRKAGPQEEIGYVSQSSEPPETKEQAPEIGCVSQPAPTVPHPGAQPRPELGGLSQFASIEKLETMSETEAFEAFDKLTLKPAQIPPEKS
jgi:hypothetical protein